jgi:ABC-type transporter Mla subunit MlaD
MARGSAHRLRRIVPASIVAVLVTIGVLVALAPNASRHELWVNIPDATGLYPGEAIRDAGIDVGGVASVAPIDRGHRARVGLSFAPTAWPIAHGSLMSLRWGGTISYLNYYVDLQRPKRTGPAYQEGATLPASTLRVPVEFDSLLDDFTPSVRAGLRSMLTRGGSALKAARSGLQATLRQTPPALSQADLLLTELDQSRTQLTALIGSTGRVVNALDTAQPTVRQLVSGAATTLGAVADQASALKDTLSRSPGTFTRIDATLATADRTLDLAGKVTTEVGPGVTQLHETAKPLDRLLETIDKVAPDAEATLTTAGRSAPQITALLRTATALMPTIGSDVSQAIPQLDCIRPYTPDVIAFFTNWAAFLSGTDGTDFIARVVPSAILPALTGTETDTPAQAVAQFPGFTDSFPRPPGESAGQPWFQPQCGVTPDSLNAADDPETGNSSPAPLPAPSAAKAKATRTK